MARFPRVTTLVLIVLCATLLSAASTTAEVVTNAGPTTITGDLGVNPGSATTGAPLGSVPGRATHAVASVSVLPPVATTKTLAAHSLPDTGGAPLQNGGFWWILVLVGLGLSALGSGVQRTAAARAGESNRVTVQIRRIQWQI